ncbi:MAG: cytochrome d ubiquinol oxidase subunit II [Desulfobacterales bacterium]|nr:MAG: cytochrome d ubiquinol oxidase subunit II [Desulfobacterales bacterium]
MLFDYYTLKIIWWLFVGVLLIGFALLGGFDLGIGALLPFVAKNDEQRRVLLNAIGPTWEGNQVWFITAGGALFAAWPLVYAVAFSGFYWAMLLVLFALFFRPVGFEYRSKLADPRWRTAWDWGLFIGGGVPALVFGVAFGNLLQGVPFQYDEFMRPTYTGSFWGLLNPFALLAGIVSLSMLIMHGAVYLQLRTEAELNLRARTAVRWFGLIFMAAFALAGIWQGFGIDGFRIVSSPDPGTAFGPLAKTVEVAAGAWLQNYGFYPWMMLAPVLGFGGGILAIVLSSRDRPGFAFVCSGAALAGVILTAGFAMFPFIIPSRTAPNGSLTAFDATSSHRTLNLMFIAVVVFLPIVLAYTGWVYRVLRGKITEEKIRENTHSAY